MTDDRLYFYKKSASKPPGRGVHDVVSDPSKYSELSKIPDWRKKLDEYYVAPFEYDGAHYNTVMHMVIAQKVNLVDPDYAWEYTLDSGSDLGQLDYHVFEHRNDRRLHGKALQEWENMKDEVLYNGDMAKFTQHQDLREILELTDSAELWSTPDRGIPASRREILEQVRNDLR